MINWRYSVVLKKARRYALNPVRCVVTRLEADSRRAHRPPIICNSVPKSGTHLLIQILQAVPELRDWGLFLATTPSFRFNEIGPAQMARKIAGLAAGELVGAHLYYDPVVRRAIADSGAVHYFIYRDPRDVAISEAFYLAEMNRWHRLHSTFSRLPDVESRIMCAIEGVVAETVNYPDIASRYRKYLSWIDAGGVVSVRFEDLVGEGQAREVHRLISGYCSLAVRPLDADRVSERALALIDPRQSHTFRVGTTGQWRKHFSEAHRARFKELAGDLLVDLGYERDLEW